MNRTCVRLKSAADCYLNTEAVLTSGGLKLNFTVDNKPFSSLLSLQAGLSSQLAG